MRGRAAPRGKGLLRCYECKSEATAGFGRRYRGGTCAGLCKTISTYFRKIIATEGWATFSLPPEPPARSKSSASKSLSRTPGLRAMDRLRSLEHPVPNTGYVVPRRNHADCRQRQNLAVKSGPRQRPGGNAAVPLSPGVLRTEHRAQFPSRERMLFRASTALALSSFCRSRNTLKPSCSSRMMLLGPISLSN